MVSFFHKKKDIGRFPEAPQLTLSNIHNAHVHTVQLET